MSGTIEEYPWVYRGDPVHTVDNIPENVVGFVYKITNLVTGKAYIGKKLLTKSKTRQVKGKKKRFRIESDWKTYYGSNAALKQDVEKFGERMFARTILHFCTSKGACSYFELMEQIHNKVLECPDQWYNEWFSAKIHRKHLRHPLTIDISRDMFL